MNILPLNQPKVIYQLSTNKTVGFILKRNNMTFELLTSGYFYPKKEDRDKLSKLGFTFKPSDYNDFIIQGNPNIEINSLEELIEFSDNYGEIIVTKKSIEIYNDYRE